MTKAEFKKQVMALLSSSVDGLDHEDKAALVRRAATEFEKGQPWDTLTRESLGLTTNSALFSVARQHMKTRCGLPKRSNVVTAALNKSIGGLVKANVESLTHVRTILLFNVSNASARS